MLFLNLTRYYFVNDLEREKKMVRTLFNAYGKIPKNDYTVVRECTA